MPLIDSEDYRWIESHGFTEGRLRLCSFAEQCMYDYLLGRCPV